MITGSYMDLIRNPDVSGKDCLNPYRNPWVSLVNRICSIDFDNFQYVMYSSIV